MACLSSILFIKMQLYCYIYFCESRITTTLINTTIIKTQSYDRYIQAHSYVYRNGSAYLASLSETTDYSYRDTIWNCNDWKLSPWEVRREQTFTHLPLVLLVTLPPNADDVYKHLLPFENLTLHLWSLSPSQTSLVWCQRGLLFVKYLDLQAYMTEILVSPLPFNVVAYTVYFLGWYSFEYRTSKSRFGSWKRFCFWEFVTKLRNPSLYSHAN